VNLKNNKRKKMTTNFKNITVILSLLLISVSGLSMAQVSPRLELKKAADVPPNASLGSVEIPHLAMPATTDEHRQLPFKKGDGYQRTTLVNSNTVLQRYDQKFSVDSKSSVTKNYHITDATNSGFAVAVTTKRITDTIYAMGKSMQYNSDSPSDTSSFIQKRFAAMVGKTANVSIGKRDTIYDINGAGNQPVNDTLYAFTGLQPDQLSKGSTLGLTVDYTAVQTMKKGYTWVDTIYSAQQKVKNTFWIQAKDDKTTTIAFESAVRQSYSNSNTNGVYVIDNATGVVLTRQMQSITTGYQLLNNVVYAASRRTALTESVYKTQ
jgi:hypothetical protein